MDDAAQATIDLLMIGGGVNGCGVARDADGPGLRVALCERGDLAGATSSARTKLGLHMSPAQRNTFAHL